MHMPAGALIDTNCSINSGAIYVWVVARHVKLEPDVIPGQQHQTTAPAVTNMELESWVLLQPALRFAG
jgi:hypothetical protein